jgi:hypothetical protein
MNPNTHDLTRIAEAARDAYRDNGHCGESSWDRIARERYTERASDEFAKTFNPERVLAMLSEIETLKGERDTDDAQSRAEWVELIRLETERRHAAEARATRAEEALKMLADAVESAWPSLAHTGLLQTARAALQPQPQEPK